MNSENFFSGFACANSVSTSKSPPEGIVEIGLAANDKYFPGLFVTAYSIYLFASPNAVLSYHILDTDIADDHFFQLEKALHSRSSGPQVRITRHKIQESSFPSYFPDWYGNKLTYARFLLPELLPDCHHVIYCDVDFLWLADITELWDERESSDILYGVQDIPETVRDVNNWMKQQKLQPFRQYFCAGLSFYNLDKLRKEKTIEKCFQFLREHPDIPWCDQTAINYVLRDRIRFLDKKWMTLTGLFLKEQLAAPLVLHYAHRALWLNHQTTPLPSIDGLEILWHRVQAKGLGIRLWSSLRGNYSAGQLLFAIPLYMLCRYSIIRKIVFFILEAMGRNAWTGIMQGREKSCRRTGGQNFNPFSVPLDGIRSAKDRG